MRIGGRTINNFRYADETLLLAENREDMGKMIQKIKDGSEKRGIEL